MEHPYRKILHLDLDAFFCAVEEKYDPGLRGKPFAVGGSPEHRGVVASCSYPARRYGVRSAMPMSQAVRLCPDLIIVGRSHGKYGEWSRKVMKILHNLTPLVEQLSIDEAFLEVTGLPELASVIASHLQAQIRDELDLPCSLGVATNKLIAKIANNVGKSKAKNSGTYPNAITIVRPGQEAAFIAPLPVEELWGVGPKTAESLEQLGMKTIGDIAAWPEEDLIRRFGKHGADLSRRAKGIDNRPIETERETKSVSAETTFVEDIRDEEMLKRTLRKLSDQVGRRLRKHDLAGTTVKIKLRWSDFTTLTRQKTLPYNINSDPEIYQAAEELFDENWTGRWVRLVGVGVSGFDESPVHQLGLWDQPRQDDNSTLSSTLDELRDKFGDSVIKRASSLSIADEEDE